MRFLRLTGPGKDLRGLPNSGVPGGLHIWHREQEKHEMSTKSEELKGRAKEAVGALSGDQKLEREGQADRAAASAKRKVGEGYA